MLTDTKLDREVAAIGALSRQELVDAWTRSYGKLPPKGIKRPLLELSAAWHVQARRMGGLSAATRKTLVRAGSSRMKPARPSAGAITLSTAKPTSHERDVARMPPAIGTRLLREWNGRMYAVDVTASGFVLDGKPYRSLSAIARRITGARWSGPRFFGL